MITPEERPPRLYRVKEAARALTLSERHIARLIASHELPVVRFGRAVRVSSADVDALIARCRTPHQQSPEPVPSRAPQFKKGMHP